ncbi:hypothetical protein A8E25_13010 [Burkholderia cenocepacia]|jgi:hypothetical protein|uniref:hypothetical protein n=1 Tax=Burkholderia cenocepacia TaxID=95486 RepID=UPI0002ABAECC|nr:hypothetical protein [Burkholderia cenocepacia]MCW3740564.1 hypothetical protein [Burkholderia cenocepacia]ONR61688.1 hypothetical protein A8E17_11295 [Burkholderia cenocepacia]ONR68423.1 hypothetical protein A8E18_21540 [Burkholderia cenocepacia]ONR73753.1 hypothetical protein A8E23_10715 [Burkholderia cenocepacia]ONR82703.1 hypothetical protein A8E22_11310 [Burkholderia cenocepacia]
MKQFAAIYRICPIDDRVGTGVRAESVRTPEVEQAGGAAVSRGVSTGRQRPQVGVGSAAVEMSDGGCDNLSVMPSAARRIEEK